MRFFLKPQNNDEIQKRDSVNAWGFFCSILKKEEIDMKRTGMHTSPYVIQMDKFARSLHRFPGYF